MNRKITRFAFGAKCGCGPVAWVAACASPISPARLNAPKPIPVRASISRRVIISAMISDTSGNYLTAENAEIAEKKGRGESFRQD
jgi:hypothetical protein